MDEPIKITIGGEEREFASQQELVEFVSTKEQERMSLQTEMETIKAGMGEVDDLKKLAQFVEGDPVIQSYMRDAWNRTQGGRIPLEAMPPPAAPAAPGAPAGAPVGADDISAILASMDSVDDLDGLKDIFKNTVTKLSQEMRASQSQFKDFESRVVPAVAAISEREQGNMVVEQFYRTMDAFRQDKRFQGLDDRDWKLIDRNLTRADVPPDQFNQAFEAEASELVEYKKSIAQAMRPGTRNPADLPGPLPFARGGSAAMGGQSVVPNPKDKDEWRERMARAFVGDMAGGGVEGP